MRALKKLVALIHCFHQATVTTTSSWCSDVTLWKLRESHDAHRPVTCWGLQRSVLLWHRVTFLERCSSGNVPPIWHRSINQALVLEQLIRFFCLFTRKSLAEITYTLDMNSIKDQSNVRHTSTVLCCFLSQLAEDTVNKKLHWMCKNTITVFIF